MPFKIVFKTPRQSLGWLLIVWLAIAFLPTLLALLSIIQIKLGLLILVTLALVALGLVHWQIFRNSLKRFQALSFNGSDWFLFDEQDNKIAIELMPSTRLYKYWILLVYKPKSPTSKRPITNSSLWLPKDRFADSDYRDLARTLHFIG